MKKLEILKAKFQIKNIKVYNEVFSLYFNLLKDAKSISKTSETELVTNLIDIKKDIMIYAPDIVLNKFNEWNNFVGDNPNNTKHINLFLELLLLIRKDMDNSKSKLNIDKLLRSIMSSSDEFEKFKKTIS